MGLDLVELMVEVEDIYNVEISDVDAGKLVTVGDLYEYLRSHVSSGKVRPGKTVQSWNDQSIWETLETLIRKKFWFKPKALRTEDRWTDLLPNG